MWTRGIEVNCGVHVGILTTTNSNVITSIHNWRWQYGYRARRCTWRTPCCWVQNSIGHCCSSCSNTCYHTCIRVHGSNSRVARRPCSTCTCSREVNGCTGTNCLRTSKRSNLSRSLYCNACIYRTSRSTTRSIEVVDRNRLSTSR